MTKPYVKKGYNAKCKANLIPGTKLTTPEAKKAHAAKMNEAKRSAIQKKHEARVATMSPVQAFRYGYKVGQNVTYLRWRAYADRVIQSAFRRSA